VTAVISVGGNVTEVQQATANTHPSKSSPSEATVKLRALALLPITHGFDGQISRMEKSGGIKRTMAGERAPKTHVP
jgi:hypothetical protein